MAMVIPELGILPSASIFAVLRVNLCRTADRSGKLSIAIAGYPKFANARSSCEAYQARAIVRWGIPGPHTRRECGAIQMKNEGSAFCVCISVPARGELRS